MGKVRLIKVKELENAEVPNNIVEGEIVEGFLLFKPEIGNSICVSRGNGKVRRTSVVTEVISENTFKTLNSIYKIEDVI